jgi:hypothetical protein
VNGWKGFYSSMEIDFVGLDWSGLFGQQKKFFKSVGSFKKQLRFPGFPA